jgi:hypothetical protein
VQHEGVMVKMGTRRPTCARARPLPRKQLHLSPRPARGTLMGSPYVEKAQGGARASNPPSYAALRTT